MFAKNRRHSSYNRFSGFGAEKEIKILDEKESWWSSLSSGLSKATSGTGDFLKQASDTYGKTLDVKLEKQKKEAEQARIKLEEAKTKSIGIQAQFEEKIARIRSRAGEIPMHYFIGGGILILAAGAGIYFLTRSNK